MIENKQEYNEIAKTIKLIVFILIFLILCIWSLFAVSRIYDVWAKRKEGEAELAQAESNRKIKILEAQAAEQSAIYLAQAEIIRAKGVAEANRIIGDSLRQNESYLRYLWITELKSPNKEVIYVPTEANIPILEAGKRE